MSKNIVLNETHIWIFKDENANKKNRDVFKDVFPTQDIPFLTN